MINIIINCHSAFSSSKIITSIILKDSLIKLSLLLQSLILLLPPIFPRVTTTNISSQSSQVLAKLTGIVQGHGQTLVSYPAGDPQSIAAGNAYHLTVPPRYADLGEMREAMNLNGTFGIHWEINYRKIIGIYRSVSDKFR